MEHKPALLHELLEEDQEPFHLKTYITNKRSQLKTQTTLQIRKQRRPVVHENPTNLCKHACFFSFHASPDVLRSPAKSPCKSPTAFLHIPSRTATLLVEAAMRIQKQHQSKPRPPIRTGFTLLGSFLKRLKNRKRALGESDIIKIPEESESLNLNQNQTEAQVEESVRTSCSCSNRRLSSADWTEQNNEDTSLTNFEASTSSRVSDLSEEIAAAFCFSDESCFCSSPFSFSLHQSPSSTGRRTPEFSSPAASPSRRLNQEKENPDNVHQVEEEEEKEQCSPVSVLDPPFDEDDERGNCDAEEEDEDDDDDGDYDMQCSFENVQRAKQQLMYRLRRFEKLAELDPIELERKLLEGSDDEGRVEREESDQGDEPLMSRVLKQSSLKYDSRSMKRLVSDLIVEEKGEMISLCGSEVVMGRICNRLDSWKEVEFDTIDMMIGLDFKKEIEGWAKFGQQGHETAAEIEVAICMVLIQELTEELLTV